MILPILIVLLILYFVLYQPTEKEIVSPMCQQFNFTVIFAQRPEFMNAKVLLRVGQEHVLKNNTNGSVTFGFDGLVPLDGVRIRTSDGKEFSYGPQKFGTNLYVDTMTHFEMSPFVDAPEC